MSTRDYPCDHREQHAKECCACEARWCDHCDPSPAALCHYCHGRGYSTHEIAEPYDGDDAIYVPLPMPSRTWHLDIEVTADHDLKAVLDAITVLAHEHPGAITLCDSDGVIILDYPRWQSRSA